MAFMHGAPNKGKYWHCRKQDVFACCHAVGQPTKPTACLTLSASEIHRDILMKLLQRLHIEPHHSQVPFQQLRLYEKSMLVSNDPMVRSVYFDHVMRVIMQIVQHKTVALFAPYFKGIEFQHWDSAHARRLHWLYNAFNEDISPEMPQTMRMAELFISLDAESLRRPRCQTHKHAQTCYENDRTKCRFNAPFWTVERTRVIMPLPPATL
ncbi:hypothetical protein MRX96_011762 [Rhipicephalus microplus]